MLKTFFAGISFLFALGAYIPYFVGIWKKETKPHILTWLTWFLLTAMGFFISYNSGGGAGSFTFALQSLTCLTVVVCALMTREKNIVKYDWMVFTIVIIILFFYIFTKNALLSVIFAASIDSLGYIPTFRKSYRHPFQEPVLTYTLGTASWGFSLLALSNFSFTTMLYPLAIVSMNFSLILFLLFRRRKLRVTSTV